MAKEYLGPTSAATNVLSTIGQLTAANYKPIVVLAQGASTSGYPVGTVIFRDGAGASSAVQRVYIQNTAPTGTSGPYMWWDTTGGNLTLWIEDGT